MEILITGGTGFIGRYLVEELLKQDHEVTILTRDKNKEYPDIYNNVALIERLEEASELKFDVIINLAGEPIAKKRWSSNQKQTIYQSRIVTTKKLIDWIKTLDYKPRTLISGSAIGYYGNQTNNEVTEDSFPHKEFTNYLCKDWEEVALSVEKLGVRVCLLRIGIVLGYNEGVLAQMIFLFKVGLGSIFGTGSQWMSWISIFDMVSVIMFLINNKDISGPVNATAPNPVTNSEFSKALAKVLSRPLIFKTPSFMLKLVFGEMSKLLLEGQKVLPKKLLDYGFKFKYPDLDSTFSKIFSKQS